MAAVVTAPDRRIAPLLRASILIPTHEHASTLPAAVAGVQAQAAGDVMLRVPGRPRPAIPPVTAILP
jgi:hypothetical protein